MRILIILTLIISFEFSSAGNFQLNEGSCYVGEDGKVSNGFVKCKIDFDWATRYKKACPELTEKFKLIPENIYKQSGDEIERNYPGIRSLTQKHRLGVSDVIPCIVDGPTYWQSNQPKDFFSQCKNVTEILCPKVDEGKNLRFIERLNGKCYSNVNQYSHCVDKYMHALKYQKVCPEINKAYSIDASKIYYRSSSKIEASYPGLTKLTRRLGVGVKDITRCTAMEAGFWENPVSDFNSCRKKLETECPFKHERKPVGGQVEPATGVQ